MSSIYDGLKYLYAEQLQGKAVKLVIKAADPEKIIGDGGRSTDGWVLSFDKTDKKLVVSGATIRRQLAAACGTEDPSKMIGKEITLYPVKSVRSISGQAIRVKVPEVMA